MGLGGKPGEKFSMPYMLQERGFPPPPDPGNDQHPVVIKRLED